MTNLKQCSKIWPLSKGMLCLPAQSTPPPTTDMQKGRVVAEAVSLLVGNSYSVKNMLWAKLAQPRETFIFNPHIKIPHRFLQLTIAVAPVIKERNRRPWMLVCNCGEIELCPLLRAPPHYGLRGCPIKKQKCLKKSGMVPKSQEWWQGIWNIIFSLKIMLFNVSFAVSNSYFYYGKFSNVLGPDRSVLLKYIHRNDNGQESLFTCSLCGKSNAQKNNMMIHVESVHFPGMFAYSCKYCPKVLNTKKALYGHVNNYHK